MKCLVVLLRTTVTPALTFSDSCVAELLDGQEEKKYNGRSCACNKTITELNF